MTTDDSIAVSDRSGQAGVGAGLCEQIDQFATQLLLADESAVASSAAVEEFAAALSRIGESARQLGCATTSQIATTLAKDTQAGRDAPALLAHLSEGIERLQKATTAELKASSGASRREVSPAPAYSLATDPELLMEFVVESREHLASVESQSLVLEQDPSNVEAINSVFRSFHTIKGLAGFLELGEIQEVSHDVESILDEARNARLTITPALIDLVLESADYLDRSVRLLEERLQGLTPSVVPNHKFLLDKLALFMRHQESPPAANLAKSVATEDKSSHDATTAPAQATSVAASAAREAANGGSREHAVSSVTVRVDAAKLDYLMDMVGEMVIAQSLLSHEPALASLQNQRLVRNLSQLSRATGEVQRTAMSMRMVPIHHVFQRIARLVRDLSRKTGKPVNLETSGEETEVDKSIAEEVADPLMHMVRNSLDHGIEDKADRKAAGKNPTACIRLAAYHQSGQVVVEVSDDGRGLDRLRILKKAQEKRLVDEGASLTDNEVFNLIFEPGFSTAEQVTDVSGRGVGMDVVRKHVQKLRGWIEIQSTPGKGASFLLRLPLTLAIIDGLVVGVGQYRYIVPIFAVKEMFRPAPEQVFTVESRDEAVLVRGRLLPIVRLHRLFCVEPKSQNPWEALFIVAESEGRRFCLMVDDLIGKQEVVIKGLGEYLKNIPGIAGGAILGDGRVGLILDMAGIFGGESSE
jgi:two-component system chemotaxis sensor kinase CheA